jgi:hypothetical protein
MGIESQQLFLQHLTELQGVWSRINLPADTLDKDPRARLIDQALRELENPSKVWSDNWRKSWRVEQVMVDYFPDAMLVAEGQRRFAEADLLKLDSAERLKTDWKSIVEKGGQDRTAALRATLAALLEELHWFRAKADLGRESRALTARQITYVAIALTVAALLPYVHILEYTPLGLKIFPASSDTYTHIYGLYTAVSFGLLGALFSRLTAFQSSYSTLNYTQISNTFRMRVIWLRLVFGMIGSVVLFYLILSGLLSGEMLPKLDQLKYASGGYWPGKDAAKLIIWSFIGGFSERFVSNVLQRTEAAANKEDKPIS